MTQEDSARQFMQLYQGLYEQLHSSWAKGELPPSAEALAVMRHLMQTGPLTITEAARHFNRAQSAMSELIDRLQANGYVNRIKDNRDKRRTLIWVTEAGRALDERSQEVMDRALLQESLDLLSEQERRQLMQLMQTLLTAANTTLTKRKQSHG